MKAKELLASTRSRFLELQNIKTADNGYYDLFHIVDGLEQLKYPRLKSLSPYPEPTAEELASFEIVYPHLKTALSKPYFFCNLNDVVGRKDAIISNYGELILMNESLLAYGKSMAQTDPDQALEAYLLSWKMGAGTSGKGKAINQSLSNEMQTSTLERIAELLATGSLSSESVQHCLDTLKKHSVSKEDFVASTDLEFLWFHNTVTFMENGERFDFRPEEFAALELPRERAAFNQIYLRGRKKLKDLISPDHVSDEALANQGLVLTAIAYPDWSRFVLKSQQSLTRLEAVKVLCTLQLFKAEKKSYPARLEELVPKYLKTAPKDYLSEDGKFVYEVRDGDFRLATDSELLKDLRDEDPPNSSPQVYKPWRSEK